jgi:hypothetical protein
MSWPCPPILFTPVAWNPREADAGTRRKSNIRVDIIRTTEKKHTTSLDDIQLENYFDS